MNIISRSIKYGDEHFKIFLSTPGIGNTWVELR
jgi:hypothetical protein